MPERTLGDPTPRTLESLTQAMKAIEDKTRIEFEAQREAVKLLQAAADRQPSSREVQLEVKALKEMMETRFAGDRIALTAALETRKEASDRIETNFSKQFDNLSKNIDDLKERINRTDGRGTGRNDFIGWIVAGVAIVGGLIAILAKFPT